MYKYIILLKDETGIQYVYTGRLALQSKEFARRFNTKHEARQFARSVVLPYRKAKIKRIKIK